MIFIRTTYIYMILGLVQTLYWKHKNEQLISESNVMSEYNYKLKGVWNCQNKESKIPKNSKIYLLEVIKNPDRSKNYSSHGMFVSCIMYEDPLAETSISKNR